MLGRSRNLVWTVRKQIFQTQFRNFWVLQFFFLVSIVQYFISFRLSGARFGFNKYHSKPIFIGFVYAGQNQIENENFSKYLGCHQHQHSFKIPQPISNESHSAKSGKIESFIINFKINKTLKDYKPIVPGKYSK